MMQRYVQGDGRNKGIRNTMCMAMLIQSEPVPEKLKTETLKHISAVGPVYLRKFSATLSRILAAADTAVEAFDHRVTERRRPFREFVAWPIFRQNSCPGVNDGVSPRNYFPHPFHQQ